MGHKTCKAGHVRTAENTIERFGVRTCLDCSRGTSRGAARRGTKKRRTRTKVAPVSPASDEALYGAASAVVLSGEPVRAAAREWDVPESDVKRQAWALAKRLVRQRDGDRCWRCGAYGEHDVHHRRGRQSGGTSNPRIAYGLANLILLDRDCHEWAEAHFDDAVNRGWRLRSGDDPEDTPVLNAPTGTHHHLTHEGTRERTR